MILRQRLSRGGRFTWLFQAMQARRQLESACAYVDSRKPMTARKLSSPIVALRWRSGRTHQQLSLLAQLDEGFASVLVALLARMQCSELERF